MNIFSIFFLILGGPGEVYVGGGGGGASIFRLGPSWFTYTLHLIIIYMSNIEAI